MKPDGVGGWQRDYSGMNPRELRAKGLGGLQECSRLIAAHELLDEICDSEDFLDLKRAVLRLAQYVTGQE